MILLNEAARDALEELNQTCLFPGRRLEPIPTKHHDAHTSREWVLPDAIVADRDYWSHFLPLLDSLPKKNYGKEDLMDTTLDEHRRIKRDYAETMRNEKTRRGCRRLDQPQQLGQPNAP